MILMLIVCVIHQILATNYIFQGRKDQVERYIYSSDCFDNYERVIVRGERHQEKAGIILARVDKADGFIIKPYCLQITFELPTKIQFGKRARITINQSLPGNADIILLENIMDLRANQTELGVVFLGCLFKGFEEKDPGYLGYGGYFGKIAPRPSDSSIGFQPQAKVAPMENFVSIPPVSCSFEVGLEYFKNLLENTNEDWTLVTNVYHTREFEKKSMSKINVHDVLFPKYPYPQDSLPMKKHDGDIGDICVSSNVVNCFFAPQCFESTEYEPNCPALFIVQYNNSIINEKYILITLESSRSDVKALRLRLQKYTPNEDLGQDSHSRRIMQFDCIFDGEKRHQNYYNASSVVSNISISRTKSVCSFRIDLNLGQEPKDIFDNTSWEMSFDSESYYQIIRPRDINWKG